MTHGRAVRAAVLLTGAMGLAHAVHAQPRPAGRPSAAPREVQSRVLTDTISARIETTVRGGALRAGSEVRGRLLGVDDTVTVWSGAVGTLQATGADAIVRGQLRAPRVRRWSPDAPTLYRLVLTIPASGDRPALADTVRIGFRHIAAANGRILLNGRPLFLRGNAINPPGRNLPDSLIESRRFATEYFQSLKAAGVNIVRLGTVAPTWLDAADETGMLLFQGSYGVPKGGTASRPPANLTTSLTWYRTDVLGPQVNHPSVVIYTLANEVADADIHYASDGAAAMGRFLQTVYDSVHAWDPTRLIIANAGYGFGRVGELCDLHRYWGWYYNSFLSYYTLRDPAVCWRGRTGQPITLSEVVGNYTGADGRFNLVSDTKQPDSQLNWTGHAPDAEQGPRALAYQAWLAGQAIEITRRLRVRNPNLAGLSPFTILFGQWHGITSVAEMRPKPVVAQLARSYQPVLLSWELWAPQVYAGATLRPTAHVVNDDLHGAAVRGATLRVTLRASDGHVVTQQARAWPTVPYYAAVQQPVTITIPATAPPGTYLLDGALVRGRDTLSHNSATVRVFAPLRALGLSPTARAVRVYDPSGRTRRALTALGVQSAPVLRVSALDPARDALVVGSEAWDATLAGQTGLVEQFVARGGRVLILDQRPEQFSGHWLPGGVRLSVNALDHADIMPGGRPWAQGMAVNPERPQHAVFRDLTRDDFFLWSDYTNWTDATPGFPAVYPVTRGFALTRPHELGRIAVLANYDHGLLGVALAEFFSGKGSTVLSGFDLVPRVGRDPVADRLLRNLVSYVVGAEDHEVQPLIADSIIWGDYASERGLVTGVHSGLLVNTVPTMPEALRAQYPVKIDAKGFWTAGDAGGWNTRPAIQYVAQGRRLFGPYEFTSGGSYRVAEESGAIGEGRVWLRVPSGRTVLQHTFDNPAIDVLDVEVSLNGVRTVCRVPAKSTQVCATPVPTGATALALVMRGDRRLVLRRTDVH